MYLKNCKNDCIVEIIVEVVVDDDVVVVVVDNVEQHVNHYYNVDLVVIDQ